MLNQHQHLFIFFQKHVKKKKKNAQMIVYIGVERGRSHFKMYHTTTKQERGGGREEKDCI